MINHFFYMRTILNKNNIIIYFSLVIIITKEMILLFGD
jgi:hypothetical protein